VAWLGDSIVSDLLWTGTKTWHYLCSRRPSVNLGIPGERVEGLLRRVLPLGTSTLSSREQLPSTKSRDCTRTLRTLEATAATLSATARLRVVVLLTGNNNLAVDTAADIAHRVIQVALVVRSRVPSTHVLLLGLFSKLGCTARKRELVREVNQQFEALCAPHAAWLHYIDLCAKLSPRAAFDGESNESISELGVPSELMVDTVHLNDLGCHALALAIDEAISFVLDATAAELDHQHQPHHPPQEELLRDMDLAHARRQQSRRGARRLVESDGS